jgi:glutamyl-tRNA reductase
MQRLLLLGINHTTAPLQLRERLAFSGEQRLAALTALREKFPQTEAVLLSTCNRVELYVARPVHAQPRVEQMIELLGVLKNVPVKEIEPHVYHKAEKDVITHLFSVAGSLNSMVLGETQILGQVREAYELAHSAGFTSGALNPLFQKAVSVGKQVMTETPIAEGRVSVGSVAVDCARRIFDHFNDKTVLTIGAGKMASLVLQGFAQLKCKRLLVCNRDTVKGSALGAKFGASAVPFDALHEYLVAADIVISSTAAQQPIITRARFESLLRERRYRPAFLIDIALPRDIEASVGKLENVYLYNLDDLQHVVSTTRATRAGVVEGAQAIVDAEVERFLSWNRAREMGPLIDNLYRKHHELARAELERTIAKLPNLSESDRAQLEELTRRIVNKLLHDPIKALRDSGGVHGDASGAPYVHALEKLFQLESTLGGLRDEQTEK